uniref:SBF1/SBF2 domain-containing protein n=1 Tax=Trichogramma kaykai TaxID=54128 RepID=A0ABD2WJF8_9HYME
MVDATAVLTSTPNCDGDSFMRRTRGALRSMRSVLGGGGEYLQGLSTRLGTALSSSHDESDPTTSPSTQTSQSRPVKQLAQETSSKKEADFQKKLQFSRYKNESMYEDYDAMIRRKFEQQEMARCSRISRKYPGMSYEEIASSKSTSQKQSEPVNVEDPTSPGRDSIESADMEQPKEIKAPVQECFEKLNSKVARAPNRYQSVIFRLEMPSSSSSASDADYAPHLDSSGDGRKDWQRSGSSASIQSWTSSLSADSQSEEAAVEFMKMFVPMLFQSPCTIEQEQKAQFGQMVLTEPGRIWFARVVSSRRARPCISEESFYSLAQHFAVALFECHEADDFGPAKNLMNMCFTFYHEIEVPGIEPYREYLYTNLRVQPIWTSMRFWTAAFFDAVQCERAAKPVPPKPKSIDQEVAAAEDRRFHANIVFGQLGTFTCNMHAFGLPRNLCLEFLKKQCIIANLTPGIFNLLLNLIKKLFYVNFFVADQEKMLKDNIDRMFDETEPWR